MPYLGLGMTDQHCSLLKAQLVEFIKMQMRSEGSTYYSPEWAAASDSATTAKEEKKRKNQSDPKIQPKPPKKPKNKKKDEEELLEDSDSASETEAK